MVAMLLHFTCHPVNAFAQVPNLLVSADWPGAWATEMRRRYGESCVPLVVNGCCGNINPWPAFEPDFHPDHRRMGRELAETACAIVNRLSFQEVTALECRSRTLPLPVREVEPCSLESAENMLSQFPEPRRDTDSPATFDHAWVAAARTMSAHLLRQRQPELPYQIQVIRVGDTALVGLPGEPFVEGQLRIKIDSPTYPTYVVHCAFQYVGYIPVREAFPRGGHEVDWSKLAPDALDLVVENAVGTLKEVFCA